MDNRSVVKRIAKRIWYIGSRIARSIHFWTTTITSWNQRGHSKSNCPTIHVRSRDIKVFVMRGELTPIGTSLHLDLGCYRQGDHHGRVKQTILASSNRNSNPDGSRHPPHIMDSIQTSEPGVFRFTLFVPNSRLATKAKQLPPPKIINAQTLKNSAGPVPSKYRLCQIKTKPSHHPNNEPTKTNKTKPVSLNTFDSDSREISFIGIRKRSSVDCCLFKTHRTYLIDPVPKHGACL